MAERARKAEGARKRQFLVLIDPDIKRQVKILAAQRDVSASGIVQAALQRYLDAEVPYG